MIGSYLVTFTWLYFKNLSVGTSYFMNVSVRVDPYIFNPLKIDPRPTYKIVYGLEDYYIERGFSSKKKT